MKHRIAKRSLGRQAHHRKQMFESLTESLLEHGSLVTTEAKAKEFRRVVEPLISEAREELTLHRRRRLLAKLRNKEQLEALVSVAQANKERPGGYLRLTRLPESRGDGAAMMRVDLLGADSRS